MASNRVERRLAAVLAADMVGFSRLMERDEDDTLSRQRGHRAELIDPTIKDHGGRIVKTTGDGLLVEFPSALEAVKCAARIQEAMLDREADVAADAKIQYRIGINLGDIVIEGDDIFGDGVNLASRLETLCEPGAMCASDVVYQTVSGKLDLEFTDLGQQKVKNIARPIQAWQWAPDTPISSSDGDVVGELEQDIRFCLSTDGTQIAYATVGNGPPLVKAPNWMNHLEYDWQSPVWRHVLKELASKHTLVRFDQRANGLSDWDVESITFENMIEDMNAVVEAAGLERFPLFGISQGCSYSIAYSLLYPERVTKLVLYGGFAKGPRRDGSEDAEEQSDLTIQMIRQGWGKDNPAFRQFFTSQFMPGATKEQMDWFNELQRKTTSPENAVRLRSMSQNIDVSHLLSQVTVPTLVLHCRDDAVAQFNSGRRMAAGIPNARFVALDGQNHLMLEDEPAWPRFLHEVSSFLAE